MAMVSNHSQYLCPDYMNPNPTMDAGKSPLALLAQTCNSIGLPDPPARGKTILPATEKSTSPSKKDCSTKTDSEDKSKADSPKSEPRSSSAAGTDENGNKSKENGTTAENSEDRPTSAPENPTSSSGRSQPMAPTVSTSMAGRCVPTLPPGYPMLGLPHFPPAPLAHMPLSLASGYPSLPLLGAGLGSSLPRVCTDPLCKSCPPSHAGRCPLGCTQCTAQAHQQDLSAMLLANSYSSLLHGMPPMAPQLPPSSVAAFSTAGSLQSLMGSTGSGSNVCNWVGSDGLCLKRFASAEELMNHMRSHATQDQGKPSLNPLFGLGAAPTGRVSPRSAYLNALRFHPYSKLPSPGSVGSAPLAPHLPFPSGYPAAALSALYGQRLPGSLPHP